MNTIRIRSRVSALLMLLWVTSPNGVHANDMQAVFEQARALFYQGKFAEAKPLLEQVAVANPRHTDTAAMLARIKVMEKKGPTLQDKYAGLVLEKIDFADVTVPEALQGLQMMAKGASDGKVVPNFILRGEKTMTQTINLSLANIPLDQAIAYVAQLSSTPYWYEEHAVVFSAAGN